MAQEQVGGLRRSALRRPPVSGGLGEEKKKERETDSILGCISRSVTWKFKESNSSTLFGTGESLPYVHVQKDVNRLERIQWRVPKVSSKSWEARLMGKDSDAFVAPSFPLPREPKMNKGEVDENGRNRKRQRKKVNKIMKGKIKFDTTSLVHPLCNHIVIV